MRNTGSDGSWDYDDGVVYHNGAIDFIATKEGRLVPNGSSYTYQYNLQDHLGNNRVSFYSNSGTSTLLQEDEYYSFGLRKSLYDNSNNNRYLYNGKEVQTDLANQYDFGGRYYDSFIGRWGSVDPLAEKDRRWSVYNYGFDNSLRFEDPDGMWPDDDDDPNKQKGFFRPPTSGQKLIHPFLSAWQSLSFNIVSELGINDVDDKIADMSSSKSNAIAKDALSLSGKTLNAIINIATAVDGVNGNGEAELINIGETVHANSKLSTKENTLYKLETKDGEYLKTGITSKKNIEARYTKKFMADKNMFPVKTGTRAEMLKEERTIIENDPGPLNKEPWAGKKKESEWGL